MTDNAVMIMISGPYAMQLQYEAQTPSPYVLMVSRSVANAVCSKLSRRGSLHPCYICLAAAPLLAAAVGYAAEGLKRPVTYRACSRKCYLILRTQELFSV